MTFQAGHKLAPGGKREGSGRPVAHKNVIKNFLKEYPNAYYDLMEKELKRGLDTNSMSAQYVIDRIKGKIGVTVDLTVGVLPYDTAIKAIETAAEKELLVESTDDVVE